MGTWIVTISIEPRCKTMTFDDIEEHLAQAMELVAEVDDAETRIEIESGLQRAHSAFRTHPQNLYQYCEEVE